LSEPPKPRPSGRCGDLSPVSLQWLEQADPVSRKARGQYLTPRPVAEALIDRVGLQPGLRVLDPGVGTGELLRALLDREPDLEVTGWDTDPTAIRAAGELVPEARLKLRSALDPDAGSSTPAGSSGPDGTETGGFDLVIGNPPYFQLRLDPEERKRFAGVISGRPNIFALFFQIGLQELKPGGTLAFIVPPSMNSGAYFEALREYIAARAKITDLTILEGTGLFEGANTAIQLLVLRKNGPEEPVGRISGTGDGNPTHRGFIYRREVEAAGFRRVLFGPDPGRLAAEFEGRSSLWELGLEATTGQVIWNENRARLFPDPGPGRVPLIWSRSIGEGELRTLPPSAGKPGFYDTLDGGRPQLLGPAIVVNRVVGAVGRGELRAALVPEGMEFLAENHVNVIRSRGPAVDWEGVLAALRMPGVVERVRLLTGNTQISARELTHLLPLDLAGVEEVG